MFPIIRIKVTGLDPNAFYSLLVEFNCIDNVRYKYAKCSSSWTFGTLVKPDNSRIRYFHPNSPSTGKNWMSVPISFGRVKLTNTLHAPEGQIQLSSMHKYQPHIVILKNVDTINCTLNPVPSFTVKFMETQFIAVTAYQNENITKLKIYNNPFAKGFRKVCHSACKKRNRECKHKNSYTNTIVQENCTDTESMNGQLSSPGTSSSCVQYAPQLESFSNHYYHFNQFLYSNYNLDGSSVQYSAHPHEYYEKFRNDPVYFFEHYHPYRNMAPNRIYYGSYPVFPLVQDCRPSDKQKPKKTFDFSIRSLMEKN